MTSGHYCHDTALEPCVIEKQIDEELVALHVQPELATHVAAQSFELGALMGLDVEAGM